MPGTLASVADFESRPGARRALILDEVCHCAARGSPEAATSCAPLNRRADTDRPRGFGDLVDYKDETRQVFGRSPRIERDAGVPKVQWHDLRHSCVSLLLALGANPRVVMEIVGHSALEMTMNVYAHVAVDQQWAALDWLDGLLDGEPIS